MSTGQIEAQAAEELAQATHLYYAGDANSAVKLADKVAKQTDSPQAHYLLALCLRKSGPQHSQRALESIERAIEQPPFNADPRAQLAYAGLLLRRNRALDCVQTLQKGFELGLAAINGREAFALQGDALRALCNFTDALAAYRKSLEYDAKYARPNEGLIETLLTLDANQEALGACVGVDAKARVVGKLVIRGMTAECLVDAQIVFVKFALGNALVR